MPISPSQRQWLPLFFFPIPLIFYWYTCLPSIGLGDSVLFLHAIKQLKVSTWVNNHNLTAIWGWIINFLPIGDLAYRGNFSCVLTGSVAVTIFFMAVYKAHQSLVTALISALFLMVSHSIWWHSTDLADYGMNTVLIATMIYLYVQLQNTNKINYLYALFFLSGLAIFQHYLLGTFLIGAGAALLYRLSTRKENLFLAIGFSSIFFLIGLSPWMLTFLHDVSVNNSVSQTISGCMGGPFKNLFFKQSLWNGAKEVFFLIFMQFPSLYIVPALLGIYFFFRAWKVSESSVGILVTFIPVFIFELGINTWAQFAQLLSDFLILAFWASFAVHWIVSHPRVVKSTAIRILLIILVIQSLAWTTWFYANLSKWGEDKNSSWYARFNNTYTLNTYHLNEFLANPNKRHYHDIENACKLILTKLPAHAQFWDSDSRLFFQLKEYYQQYYNYRPDLDIRIVNSFGLPNWGADKNTFANEVKNAYLTGKDLFLCSTGHPFLSNLAEMPDKKKYQFEKFPLNDQLWVYRLVTIKDKNPTEKTLWAKWETIPTDKPVLINLSMDNVLDFHEGNVFLQDDMGNFGPFWKYDDQIFFSPNKPNAEIGFLLHFDKAFTGTLGVTLTTAFDTPMVDVLLNNKPLTTTPIDLYMVAVQNQRYQFDNVQFEAGNNILSVRIAGKNEKSKDIKLGIDTIDIK